LPSTPIHAPARLWAIAERFYGDGSQYPKIASANGIANPDLIMVGQELTIPSDSKSVPVVSPNL